MNLPLIDDPKPPAPPPLELVTSEGKRRIRRRRSSTSAIALAGLVVVIGIAWAATRETDEGVGVDVGVAGEGSTTTTSSPTPSSSTTSTDGRAISTGGAISLQVPSGWSVANTPAYWNLDEPLDELTISTFAEASDPSKVCDLPVQFMEHVGPTDAFLSVRAAPSGAAYIDPQPDGSLIVPIAPPENAYAGCLQRSPDFLFTATGFRNGTAAYVLYAGLGKDAPPSVRADLRAAVDSMVASSG